MSLDLPTRLDLYALGRAYLQRSTRLEPGIVDVEGSDANLFVGSQSFVGYATIQQLAARTAALTLDGSEGEDLDRYAWDRYRLLRKGASAAVGYVRFFRATAAAGQGVVALGTKIVSMTGIEYVTSEVASFGATALSTLPCRVRSTRAGASQNLGRNQLRIVAAPAQLFDPSIQVTNDDPTAHGADREDDSIFKRRIRDFWRTARRGTLSAIEFGAQQVEGIESASASEEIGPDARPARLVSLAIADGSGVASQALAATVDQALLEYRAGGIAVLVYTSLPQIVPVRLHLSFAAGIETSTLTETIRAAVVGYINSLGVNQILYLGRLQAVLTRYADSGLVPAQTTILEPTGDIVPATGRTLRTSLDNVTTSAVA